MSEAEYQGAEEYAIYQAETGRLLSSGRSFAPETLLLPGQLLIKKIAPGALGDYYVENGELVKKSDQPSDHHTFDYAAKAWIDPRTLDDLRTAAHAAIERWRDDQEHAGMKFWHAGRRWDGGLVVRQRLQPVLGLAALPDGFFWTDADNSDVPISMPALQSLSAAHEQALVLRGFDIHARQRAMKAEIADMDRAALLAFAPGWPPA